MSKISLPKMHYAYSQMDKEDPEEVFHRRARFLIYKVLKEADSISRRPRPWRRPRSFLWVKMCRLKVKIGKKLMKLRRSLASAVRFGVNKHSVGGVKAWKRVFHGGAATELPAPIFSLEV